MFDFDPQFVQIHIINTESLSNKMFEIKVIVHGYVNLLVILNLPLYLGASKGSGGSTPLSGGGIAGILIAAIIVTIAVIAMLVVFKRRQNGGGAALGFENTTYSYNSEQDNGKLHLNSHETES